MTKWRFTCIEEKFENSSFFWKTWICLHILGQCAERFWLFGKSCSKGLSKLHSACPLEKFWENNFFWKIYQASLSSDFEWIVSGLRESCNMFLDRVVKSAFYMSEGSIWWKTKLSKILLFILSILDIERNFLGFMWNFLQPGRRNCILRVYRNNLRKIFCGKKCSFIISEHRSGESSRPSRMYFSRGLSKLHSTCLLEPLVETFFGEKRYIFFTIFGQVVELFWILSKFFRQACQNRILLHQRTTLGKNL